MARPGERARTEREARGFRAALALIVVAALAVRVAYVLISRRNFAPQGDALFYHAGANLLADGKGFISPFFVKLGLHRPAAEHPPLYVVFLAVPSLLGMKSVLTHLLWSCGLGAATVALVGLLGRAVAGARAGLIAAAIAAIYPNLWAPDGSLQAETVAMFCVTAALLLAYRYRREPSGARLALVGAMCGLGALARSELILLVPLLVVPLAWTTRDRTARARAQWLGVSVAAALVVIAPWTVYNSTRFVHPELLSSQFGPLLASANCESTYFGQQQGYFDITCNAAIDAAHGVTLADDESQQDAVDRRAAFHYIRGHMGRLPTVEGVRLLRIVGLYHPGDYARADWYVEGRDPEWISFAALYSFWCVALAAVAGAVVTRRRSRRAPSDGDDDGDDDDDGAPAVFPLLSPVLVVVLTVLVTYASTRFRTTAEPALVVLAAVAIDGLVRLGRGRYASARN